MNELYEFWMRRVYFPLVASERLTTVVRPDDRRWPNDKGMQVGQHARVRVLEQFGSDILGVQPTFLSFTREVVIESILVRRIDELSPLELVGASPDCKTSEQICFHLGLIYNRKVTGSDIVTVINFDYLGEIPMKTTQELIDTEVLRLATQANGNPLTLTGQFCAGISAKDYAAQTPHLWNNAYQELKVERQNVRLIGSTEDAAMIIDVFRQDQAYCGGDVGVGFKSIVPPLLDALDPLAEQMQAINVIVKRDGKLTGFNTDGVGFARGLAEQMKASGAKKLGESRVMVLGSGGTASAITFALVAAGAQVAVVNRTVSKAVDLAARVNDYFKQEGVTAHGRDDITEIAPTVDAVVSVIDDTGRSLDDYSTLGNIVLPATPENVADNHHDARRVLALLSPHVVVADVVLHGLETATLRLAREAGLATQDGMPMVRHQAVEAFWLVNEDVLTAAGVTKADIARVIT